MRLLTLALLVICSLNCTSSSTARRSDGDVPANGADTASLRTQTAPVGSGDGDLLRHSLAVPTGNRATSAVLVEKLAPREARLNRPYDYRIRVTNLTDAPLADV